jgi:hypothetical protein
LIGDFEDGGLKMIDIESYFISLKASWVSRLTDLKFSNWKLIPLKYLNVFGKIWLIFKMNIDGIFIAYINTEGILFNVKITR